MEGHRMDEFTGTVGGQGPKTLRRLRKGETHAVVNAAIEHPNEWVEWQPSTGSAEVSATNVYRAFGQHFAEVSIRRDTNTVYVRYYGTS
jgi:hypothetical protein